MKAATALQNRIMMALSAAGRIVFRNNVGLGWSGKVLHKDPVKGTVLLGDARPVKFGLIKGSGDLIGGIPTVITSDMVGKRVLIFASWEVKSGTGKATPDQINFAKAIRHHGGVAEIVRDEGEAVSCRLFKD